MKMFLLALSLLISDIATATRIILQPVSMVLTTNLSGTAALSLRIPGDFNGLTDDKNGRFFKGVEIWTDAGAVADRIYGLRLEDSDGILTALHGAGQFPVPSSVFPNYPVLLSFEEGEINETATLLKGFFIPPNKVLSIDKIDPREVFDFIPSGMYFKGTFQSSNGILGGQKVRINFYWGKKTE